MTLRTSQAALNSTDIAREQQAIHLANRALYPASDMMDPAYEGKIGYERREVTDINYDRPKIR